MADKQVKKLTKTSKGAKPAGELPDEMLDTVAGGGAPPGQGGVGMEGTGRNGNSASAK